MKRFTTVEVLALPGIETHEAGWYVLDDSEVAEENGYAMIGPWPDEEAAEAAAYDWEQRPGLSPNGSLNDWSNLWT